MKKIFLAILNSISRGLRAGPAPTLHEAAERGDINAVNKLLKQGADVNAKSKYGSTALILAEQKGHTEIAKLLIDKGALHPAYSPEFDLVKYSNWRLLQTEKGLAQFVYQAAGSMNKEGIANFNLVLTPNSTISITIYHKLIEMGIAKEEIKCLDPTVTDKEIDALRDEVKEGKYKFVISDAYLLGSGWDVGKMSETAEILKYKQTATADKAQATLWLIEPELMTKTQRLQAVDRIDPFGDNRFDSKYWTKDIISLVSVENARELRTLREAVKESWNIDLIIENLHKAWLENEERELAKNKMKIRLV